MEVDRFSTGGAIFLRFSPDGRLLTVGDRTGRVRVKNIESGKIDVIEAGSDSVVWVGHGAERLLALTVAGRLLELGDGGGRGKELFNLKADAALAASDFQDRLVAVALEKGGLMLIRLDSNRSYELLPPESDQVQHLSMSPDGVWLAATLAAGGIRVFSLAEDGPPVQQDFSSVLPARAELVRFSDSGLLYVLSQGSLAIFDARSAPFVPINRIDVPTIGPALLSVSPRDSFLTLADSGGLKVMAVGGWSGLVSVRRDLDLTAKIISEDGSTVAGLTEDDQPRAWAADNGHDYRLPDPGGVRVTAMALSPFGNVLALGGMGKRVQLLHMDSDRDEVLPGPSVDYWSAMQESGPDPVRLIDFSSEGDRLVCLTEAGDLLQWDLYQIGQKPSQRKKLAPSAIALAAGPDRRLALVGFEDRLIHLWRPQKDDRVEEVILRGHLERITCLAFSPDGRLLVSGAADDFVRVWDVESGQTLGVCRGHQGNIRAVAFSPDGRLAVSAGEDETIRFWDAETMDEAAVWPINGVAVALAYASADDGPDSLNYICQDGRTYSRRIEGTERETLAAQLDTFLSASFPWTLDDNDRPVAVSPAAWARKRLDAARTGSMPRWPDGGRPLVNLYQARLERDTQEQIRTNLYRAVINKDDFAIQELLAAGASPNLRLPDGNTPLGLAASLNLDSAVRILMKAGADPSLRNSEGRNAWDLAVAGGGVSTAALFVRNAGQWFRMLSFAVQKRDHDSARILLDMAGSKKKMEARRNRKKDENEPAYDVNYIPDQGRSLLAEAVIMGDETMVALLLDHRAALESKSDDGQTPLILAAGQGHTIVVRLLLDRGAALRARDDHRRTALWHAAENGRIDTIERLIERRADVQASDRDQVSVLMAAALNGQVETTRMLIKEGADIWSADAVGRTLLSLAAAEGLTEVGRLLLDEQGFIKSRSAQNHTLLMQAVLRAAPREVAYLLENGVDLSARDRSGADALILASAAGRADLVAVLAEKGAHLETRDYQGLAPLHHAVLSQSEETVDRLIRLGANVNPASKTGQTPLMLAAQQGTGGLAALLLDAGAHIGARDEAGLTPFLHAASAGQLKTVRLLMGLGADPRDRDNACWTGLMHAARRGAADTVAYLAAQQAPLETRDDLGQNALMIAAAQGRAEAVRILLDLGADLSVRDNTQATALIHAARAGRSRCARLLLDAGANPDTTDNMHWTPLMHSAAGGDEQTFLLLLRVSRDLEIKDDHGRTVLMAAAAAGNVEMIRALLQQGAQADTADALGQTALDYAAAFNRSKIKEELEGTF